ncbi:MAG: response regulator [Elusimicrobia bacterium]|nr:response regulator [Elusimicrobiota bacterium]
MAHIMIVDDERDVVTLVKFLLERDGHMVTTAFDGADALAKLGVEPANPAAPVPDVIVLDVMMPILDGFTVSARLGGDARTKGIPLIILTAKGEMRDLFQVSQNVASYLEKPFDPKTLRERIAAILAKKP